MPMPRPKKKEPQTELEKLQAENLRLRAENALLKKVRKKKPEHGSMGKSHRRTKVGISARLASAIEQDGPFRILLSSEAAEGSG